MIIIFTLCSALMCEEHELAVPTANELTCQHVAQAEVAKHVRQGWKITKYGCKREE